MTERQLLHLKDTLKFGTIVHDFNSHNSRSQQPYIWDANFPFFRQPIANAQLSSSLGS